MSWRNTHPVAPTQHTPQAFMKPRGPATGANEVLPSLGLVSAKAQASMVQRLVQLGIRQAQVLTAMQTVPRHAFVESAFASRAYEDTVLPIGFGQTISRPSVVARMVELASGAVKTNGAWLEVGTGCGYQAAVMSHCTAQVCSIERVAGLAELAQANLRQTGYRNIGLLLGDGTQPWGTQYRSSHAKHAFERFDAIVVAAAGLGLVPAWQAQLNIGGRLIAPMQDAQGVQRLYVVIRHSEHDFSTQALEPVQFVPLLGGTRD
jgi:protein-L-isoaspartate(D-aspartate) O-methyltransferase